ncbi:MAG: pimeloyl-ACP methyl ester carboxylesterase, partial [Cyclobacteriaceae bacterium]
MHKNSILIFLIAVSTLSFAQVPKKSASVEVNGKSIYYEIYGEGKPLFLLHGYTLSSSSWLPYVEDFHEAYEVYLIDLTGHGKSEAFKESLSIRSVAQDLNLLAQHLKLDSIKAIGFSFGGDVLYQLALINPALIKSMITIGAVGTWTVDDFPEYQTAFTFENRANFPWLLTNHGTDAKILALMD